MKSKKTLYIVIVLIVAAAAYVAYTGAMQPENGVNGDENMIDEEASINESTAQDEAEDDISVTRTEADARAEDAEETATDQVTSELDYEDGDYQARSMYTVPNGTQYSVQVAMTIESDEVADVSVFFNDQEEGQTSTDFQAQFFETFKDEVVGQPVADLNLSRVGGASLTSQAFNDAVVDIRAQAS